MSLPTQPYKGARDFYPEDKRLQKYMFGVMREVAESFGYEEYDAPILEPTDLFLVKGNQEIIDEQTYTFTDRGGRSVTVRTEMTPSVSRMVAGKRQELAYPLRWYSIPNLWRYERAQRGRLREFWQLNVDIFGVDGITAEVEMIQVSDAILKKFGAKQYMYQIKLNSRVLTDYILREYLGLDDVQATSMVRLIDRMHKLERSNFEAQADAILTPDQREAGKLDQLFAVLAVDSLEALPEALKTHASVTQLQLLIESLQSFGINNAVFDVTLMRGFDYYTDIVFEVFDTNPENNRSMFGGGRYDGLVGQFGVDPVPTVGFGMGDVTLQNFLEAHNLLPPLATETDAYVILIGNVYDKVAPLLGKLRKEGVNLAVDATERKIDKQIKTAAKKGIRYLLTIGAQELESGRYSVKNLQTGQTEQHGADRLVSILKDHRGRDDDFELEQ